MSADPTLDSGWLDVRARLDADADGLRRQELLARLQAIGEACQQARRQLNDRQTFRQLQAAGAAVDAARVVVQRHRSAPVEPSPTRRY